MTGEPETLAGFIERLGLTMEAVEIPSRSDGVDWGKGGEGASHWSITIRHGQRVHALQYSQGSAHRRFVGRSGQKLQLLRAAGFKAGDRVPFLGLGRVTMATKEAVDGATEAIPPKLPGVLDSLASDVSGILNAQGFECWCSDYGYDDDSRKALATYRKCQDSAQALRQFLGANELERLCFETERL